MTTYRLALDITISPAPQDAHAFFAVLSSQEGRASLAKLIAPAGFSGAISFSNAVLRLLPPRADNARTP